MPRKRVPPNAELPYHVTARCINKEWFCLPLATVWDVMSDYLYYVKHVFEVDILSFVLMHNHFHLLIRTPKAHLSEVMQCFMKETSCEITRLSGRINQTYGGRHHKCLITSYHYFMNVYKYVYRNPVRAGLCNRVEEWPYSTLSGQLGLHRMIIPLAEDTLMFTPNFDYGNLIWLNTKSRQADEEEIRKALRRPFFKLSTPRSSGKKSELEFRLF